MLGREPESRDFIIAFAATCVIAGGFIAYAHGCSPDGMKPNAHAMSDAARDSEQDLTQPLATVYECNDENGRVMSDQPCGEDAEVRHIEMPNLMKAHPNSRSSRPSSPGRPARGGAARVPIEQDASRNDALCKSIDNQIDRINARMRRGYSSWEGEEFRRQLRALSEQRWNANCRQPG